MAAQDGAQPERHALVERLVMLVTEPAFQLEHHKRFDDPTALRQDLERALRAAAADVDSRAAPLVVGTALALADFSWLKIPPEQVFTLAREGQVEEAVRRLGLIAHHLDADWHRAALL